MKTFKEIREACWKGYKQVGGKMKNGKMVPNCVPVKEETLEEKNVPTSPEKWARAKAAAKNKFSVYPSAYANGWAAKKYKAMGGGWKSVSEESEDNLGKKKVNEDLRKWFRDKWVRFDTKGNIKGDCGARKPGEGKPKCLPQAKAHSLGKSARATAARRKRREDPNPDRKGKAIFVKTKKEYMSEERKETHYATAREALDGMGKAKFNAIIKHPTFDSHRRAMRMGGEPKFDVTEHGAGSFKVEVGTHPYLTSFHMSHRGKGPAKIWAYHHMVARTDNPKEYMTIKTHGFDKD